VSALGLVLSLIALAALARGSRPSVTHARSAAPIAAPVALGPVDINTATIPELVALPRIGPALAARIVLDRETNGPFESLEALDRVPGIGPRTIELLRPHALVRDR
jgi:competence protein ComEA